MTGRLTGPSGVGAAVGSSTSGCVRACPSPTVASNGSARQAGSPRPGRPWWSRLPGRSNCSAARLNMATRPVASMAMTPLSIVAAMFSMIFVRNDDRRIELRVLDGYAGLVGQRHQQIEVVLIERVAGQLRSHCDHCDKRVFREHR